MRIIAGSLDLVSSLFPRASAKTVPNPPVGPEKVRYISIQFKFMSCMTLGALLLLCIMSCDD